MKIYTNNQDCLARIQKIPRNSGDFALGSRVNTYI